KSKKKVKELLTPLEYARRVIAETEEKRARGIRPRSTYLRGKKIFYCSNDRTYASDTTKGRMDFILRHGGTLVPVYDPDEVTHISTNAHKNIFLERMGMKSLDEIPDRIPTVTWDWVVSGFDRPQATDADAESKKQEESEDENVMDYVMSHAAFVERLDAGAEPWMLKAIQKGQQSKASSSHVAIGQRAQKGCALNHQYDDPKTSIICDFTEILPSPPSPRGPPKVPPTGGNGTERGRSGEAGVATPENGADGNRIRSSSSYDPLAEFYAQARADRAAEGSHPLNTTDEDDSIMTAPCPDEPVPISQGFLCDTKGGGLPNNCPNQDVVDKLQELKALHKLKPSEEDKWRVFAYTKAIKALRFHPTRIRSHAEAVALPGVGNKTAQKIMEIIETGKLRRIEYERTEDVAAVLLFQGIYGVGSFCILSSIQREIEQVFTGSKIAREWYTRGCRTLDDIRTRKGGIRLSQAQEIGLKYYEEINSRMPRDEAADIYNKIKPIALKIDPKLFIEIMGSYRRLGKADCGDIDILITRPTDDGRTHQGQSKSTPWILSLSVLAGVLRRLFRELHRQGILTEDLNIPGSFDDLELIYRGLCRRDVNSSRRRIGNLTDTDFLTVPYKSRGAALLYYTGDDIFNRSLRLKANKMGYSLNQRGLYAGVIRNPSDRREKLENGIIIASETEEEILRILGKQLVLSLL
ncbi:hypothetical protein POSPLADRAFT_1153086, partial [Postia placenta MAD-698-R-SB12]